MREVACSDCSLDPLCSLLGYGETATEMPSGILVRRRVVAKGEVVCLQGDAFRLLHAVKSGSFKSVETAAGRPERVVGFYLAGELMGAEGMATGHYPNTISALEDSQLCDLDIERLQASGRHHEKLQQRIIQLMGRQVAFRHELIATLVHRRADQRVSAFLLNMSVRLREHHFNESDITLQMSQTEIGSFLGLSNATVSRVLSRLQEAEVIKVMHRGVHVLDRNKLRAIMDGGLA